MIEELWERASTILELLELQAVLVDAGLIEEGEA